MQKIVRIFLIVVSMGLLTLNNVFASMINVEIGRTKTSHNYFQLPNNDQNRVNLEDDKYLISHRVNAKIDLKDDSFLYLVYAPLTTNNSFRSGQSFQFNNSNFSSNASTEVSYKFNSYRMGYFKKLHYADNLKYWFGAILNVRDAKIEVRQGGQKDSYRNVGIVPLLGAGFDYSLNDKFSIIGHVDSLGFSQGYAYDANAEIKYQHQSHSVGFGYRTIGGGVDNDKLMNFARFETIYMSYGKEF